MKLFTSFLIVVSYKDLADKLEEMDTHETEDGAKYKDQILTLTHSTSGLWTNKKTLKKNLLFRKTLLITYMTKTEMLDKISSVKSSRTPFSLLLIALRFTTKSMTFRTRLHSSTSNSPMTGLHDQTDF